MTSQVTPARPTVGVGISLRSVSKRYQLGDGSTIVAADDIDLDLEPSTMTTIVGPSGSGKSTLLHLIGAIDRPDGGAIVVGDHDITSLRRNAAADYRASIGFVFQQFHLLTALTAEDNVIAPLVSRKVPFDRHSYARELIAAVGLDGRNASLPSQLSGGQQQRVAIARALIARPGLVLADEPTGNLDSATASDIIALLRRLQRLHGTTLVLATHDPTISAQADRTVHIRDGKLSSG